MNESMRDVVNRNKSAGYHFFDPDSLRFFNSRVGRKVYPVAGRPGWVIFVTSERFTVVGQEYSGPRRYTVRISGPDGRVDDASAFQAYGSSLLANRRARRLSGDLARLVNCLRSVGYSSAAVADRLAQP